MAERTIVEFSNGTEDAYLQPVSCKNCSWLGKARLKKGTKLRDIHGATCPMCDCDSLKKVGGPCLAPPHQDSPKVPEGGWPKLLHVVEVGPGSRPPSFRASAEDTWLPELSKQAYVSVSALLSDEVKGAIHDAHMRYQNVDPREQSEDGWAACLLQAVVEQAGGGQGGD